MYADEEFFSLCFAPHLVSPAAGDLAGTLVEVHVGRPGHIQREMAVARAALLLLLGEASALRPVPTSTRACVLRSAASAFLVAPFVKPPFAHADSETLSLLKQARTQLDPIKSMVENKDWDGVRTVVKTA